MHRYKNSTITPFKSYKHWLVSTVLQHLSKASSVEEIDECRCIHWLKNIIFKMLLFNNFFMWHFVLCTVSPLDKSKISFLADQFIINYNFQRTVGKCISFILLRLCGVCYPGRRVPMWQISECYSQYEFFL